MSTATDLLTIDEALALVLERVQPLEAEDVALEDAAGRVLAEDARSAVDLPPFPASAMDGFALRAADAPGTLPIVARIAAGRPATRALEAGEAMAIATGGVVPDGADSVVPIEDVEETRRRASRSRPPLAKAKTSGRAEATCAQGDTVVAAGTRLGPAHVGALAAAGVAARALPPRAARRRGRHGHRARRSRRAARPGRDLRRERLHPRDAGAKRGRRGRAPAAGQGRRRRDARRDRARPRGRRARHDRRRLGRRLRPRARGRGGARRRGGLLARRRAARASRSRSACAAARSSSGCRATRSRRSSASSSSSGPALLALQGVADDRAGVPARAASARADEADRRARLAAARPLARRGRRGRARAADAARSRT